jgi:outer membrane protein OmpA-like peptidoglycan-associated protein
MDIAAGNGQAGGPAGIAPDADLIFVHLADRNTGGLANFGDSVRLLEAVDFISRTAGPQPCVINISAGRICGPKDGTTLVERAFDELLASTPGRFVANSAGNYFRWRAHSCGTLCAGESRTLTLVSNPADITVNELEIWYDGADEFAVRIDPPGYTGGRPVRLGERSDLLIGDRVVGRIYHRKHDPNNGDNHIVAFLDPIGRAGQWTITLEARWVSSGRFHAWIERDDSCPGCQARFARDNSSPAITIGSIASSHLPLIVGAYDGHDAARPVAAFSSAGPCRDGRSKPDLAAPGVGVLAARSAPIGASRNPGLLVRGNGTSFATPHVTGAVALCFEAAGNQLSAREIRSLVLGSCDPPLDADSEGRLGRGYLNITRLVVDVQRALAATDALITKEPTMDAQDTVVLLSAAPATAYREYLYRPHGQLARWMGDWFEVVARPGQRIRRAAQEGDVLIEVSLGSTSPGRCVTLTALDLERVTSWPVLSPGRLLLRPRRRTEVSEPLPVEPVIDTGGWDIGGGGDSGDGGTEAGLPVLADTVPVLDWSEGDEPDYLGGRLWTFTARTLAVPVAVFCPKAARGLGKVGILVYAHGLLDGCPPRPVEIPGGLVTDPPFALGRIVDASGRRVVLVVPFLDWLHPGGEGTFGKKHRHWHALASPDHLNGLIDEVLAELGRQQKITAPSVSDLIIAGHSRAHDFLEPLAYSRMDKAMQEGALAHLSQIWAFDTTYDGEVERWVNWLKVNPQLRIHVFYRPGSPTETVGDHFYRERKARMAVTPVGERHCAVPVRRLTQLLNAYGSAPGAAAEEEPGPVAPAPAAQLTAEELTARIARCIGIWETNRGKDNPAPKESALDTVAGVHASMATIEQATMPYAITALGKNKSQRDRANPPLTVKELNAADARAAAVLSLLSAVTAAWAQGRAPDDFIAANRALITATGLSDDDVRTMFRTEGLKAALAKARSEIDAAEQAAREKAARENKTEKQLAAAARSARQSALKAAIDAIAAADRLGLGEGSLRAYITTATNWGENRAGWQRKAVDNMPDNVGGRIQAVAVSEHGTALAIPTIRSRVDAELAKVPVPATEDIVRAVAQKNNPHEPDYGLHVWQTYRRLYPAPQPSSREAEEAETEEGVESGEVEAGEAEALLGASYSHASGSEQEAETTVTFPSGATLQVIAGPSGPGQEHYDPNATGNPLLDTSQPFHSTRLSASFTVGELVRSGPVYFHIARIDPELIRCLQQLRDHVGKPVTITSGYRTYEYNKKLYTETYKKKPTKSRHSSGQAADVHIAGMSGMEIAKAAISACGPKIGVGIAQTYAHLDVRGSWAKWTYFKDEEKDALALAEIEAYRRQHAAGHGSARRAPTAPAAPQPTENAGISTAGQFTRATPESERFAELGIEADDSEGAETQRQEQCTRTWKALRDSLPEEMTKALDAGQWIEAARWGIQHGIQDVDHLTDIIFWQWFGDSRGYCKLTPGEPKFAHYADQWRQIREQHVRPAFTFNRPPERAGPTACVAHEKRLASAEPDNPPLDITGRYEEQWATPRFTLRVNQAGKHVECLLTQVVLPDPNPRLRRGQRRLVRFSGDLKSPGSKPYFELYDRERPSVPVLLSADPGTGALRISESGTRGFTAELLARTPTLLETALSELAENDIVRLYEQRPLTRHQINHLHRKLQPGALTPFLRKFFDVAGDSTPDKRIRYEAHRPLVEYLEAVWNDPEHGIEEQDRELAKFYARTILTLGKWTLHDHLTSLLDWLQLVVDRLTIDNNNTPPTSDFALTRLLGLTARLSGTGGGHTYKVSLTLSGGGLFIAGYVGDITVEKTSDGGTWKKGKKERFGLLLAGMETGGGIKPYSTIEGEAAVPFEWQPPDFPGTIEIGKAEAGAYAVSAGGGFVHIHGRGYLPVMPVIFTDLGPNILLEPKTLHPNLKLELGPAGYLGKILDRSFPKIDYTTFTVKNDYAVAYNMARQVHFCLDSAILSAEGRQAIRVMCANELPAFGSSGSHLTITGHTDRIAGPEYNRGLSELRAKNTLQAIKDALGSRFEIPEANIIASGKGEELATKEGRPDKEVNPRYRRVDIILNGRLVLTLSVQ